MRMTFEPVNKSADARSYPKLSLEKGERARILIVEDPAMRWVHTLRKLAVDDRGEPVYEKDPRRGEVPKALFAGQHFCLGSEEVLRSKGQDPDDCPTCAAAARYAFVDGPRRRFAMHVVRYRTRPGSFALAEPFSVELLAWTFADSRFDLLVDLRQEWGDLRKHDLGLGPCEAKQYQKYDIQVLPKCEYLETEQRRRLVEETYRENQVQGPGGVESLIARALPARLVEEDLEAVVRSWALQDPGAAAAAADSRVQAQADADVVGDVLAGAAGSSPAAVAVAAGVPAPAPAPSPWDGDDVGLDDLLS